MPQPKSRMLITLEQARVLRIMRNRSRLLSYDGQRVDWNPPCERSHTPTLTTFCELVDRGLIEPGEGMVYKLTPLGHAKAEEGPTLKPTRVEMQPRSQ